MMTTSIWVVFLISGFLPFTVQAIRQCKHDGLHYDSTLVVPITCADQKLVADFNGDGRADFFCKVDDNNPDHYYLSSIAGVYYTAKDAKTQGWCSTSEGVLMTGDIDGNGRADLICRFNDGMKLQVSHFKGNGFSSPGSMKNYLHCAMTSTLLIGDVNGDRVDDFVCGDQSSGNIRIHHNSHHHRIRRHSYYLPDPRLHHDHLPPGIYEMEDTFCRGSGKHLALGDVNGDRSKDLICVDVHSATNTIDVSLADKKRHFEAVKSQSLSVTLCSTTANQYQIIISDVNGDGLSDVNCAAENTGAIEETLLFYDGQQKKFDDAAPLGPTTLTCHTSGLPIDSGDLNGDGLDDILCSKSGGDLVGDYATCM